jgi:hypothetical protein
VHSTISSLRSSAAQINSAAQIALAYPDRHPGLLRFLAPEADETDIQTIVEHALVRRLGHASNMRASTAKWIIGTIIALLGAGGGAVAWLNYAEEKHYWPFLCSHRVRNPSAEELMSDDPSTPAYWTRGYWLEGGQFEIATDQRHNGVRSFKLSAKTANRLDWHQAVCLRPHSTYRLSAWVLAEGVAHSAEIKDRGANIAIHSISPDKFPKSSDPPLYGTQGEWRQVFAYLTTTSQEISCSWAQTKARRPERRGSTT